MGKFGEDNDIEIQLEELLSQLEKGNIDNEDSIRLFQEAVIKIEEYLKELTNK